MVTMRKTARIPTGYVRDRTKVYKEKWEALHPNRGCASQIAHGMSKFPKVSGMRLQLICKRTSCVAARSVDVVGTSSAVPLRT